MIFCAIPMTEKWPFFAYDDRKELADHALSKMVRYVLL
jgi:hypothetical protein